MVLTNGTTKYHPVVGIATGAVYEPIGVANALGGNQYALRIQAVQNIGKAFAFLANQVVCRNFQLIKKNFIGLVVDHIANRLDSHAVLQGHVHIDDENRHALAFAFDLVQRRRACQQNHQI